MSSPTFRSLVERHLEPVLLQAGFTGGQWDVDGSSALFCADGADYVRRYGHLVDERSAQLAEGCVDMVIEGSLPGGITDITVEFEPLGDLLERTRHARAARLLARHTALDDPDRDARAIAAILSALYAADPSEPAT